MFSFILKCKGTFQNLPLTLFIILALFIHLPALADPDALTDFCVADLNISSLHHRSGGLLPCKHPSLVIANDFIFSGLRKPSVDPSSLAVGFSRTLASVEEFPGLNTLGISLVRADFAPGGFNAPHLHPRASEVALVGAGTFYSGFVTSEGRLLATIINKGDLMVFPRGLVHFQMNIGDKEGVLFGSLDSQSPGMVSLPSTVFGTGIKDELLQKAFKLSQEELESLKSNLSPKG